MRLRIGDSTRLPWRSRPGSSRRQLRGLARHGLHRSTAVAHNDGHGWAWHDAGSGRPEQLVAKQKAQEAGRREHDDDSNHAESGLGPGWVTRAVHCGTDDDRWFGNGRLICGRMVLMLVLMSLRHRWWNWRNAWGRLELRSALSQHGVPSVDHLLRHPLQLWRRYPASSRVNLIQHLCRHLIDYLSVPLVWVEPQQPVRNEHVRSVDATELLKKSVNVVHCSLWIVSIGHWTTQ